MADIDEFDCYAAVLARYGVAWTIDATDPEFPEVGTVSRQGVPYYRVWRTASAIFVQDLRGGCGVALDVPTSLRAWAFMASGMALPLSRGDLCGVLLNAPMVPHGPVVSRLPAWLLS